MVILCVLVIQLTLELLNLLVADLYYINVEWYWNNLVLYNWKLNKKAKI